MSEEMREKKPFTIGIMTGSFYQDYSRMIVDAICDRLQDDYVQIYLFQGFDAGRFLNNNAFVHESFDTHYYSLFEYSKFVELDLLIISIGTISAVPSPVSLEVLLDRLPKVPVIVLEDEGELPNVVYITVDNYNGMKECILHLIEEHHCKKIVYLAGPREVPDAALREKAYTDTMKEQGLFFDEGYIAYGDFTDQVEEQVKALLERVPDAEAIVCANDEMAECSYRVLREMGITPGKEIKVTGFDDNEAAPYLSPPLTTVRQDYFDVAAMAAKKAAEVVHHKKISSERLPAKLKLRCSCGCESPAESSDQIGETERRDKFYEERVRVKRLQNQSIISTLVLRGILSQHTEPKEFFRRIGNIMYRVGTHRSFIALIPEPLYVDGSQKLFLPDSLQLFMSQKEDCVEGFDIFNGPLVELQKLQEYMGDHGHCHKQMAAFPLFSGEYHYGVLFVELPRDDMLFYYNVSLELGSGIRYLLLARVASEARKALEEKNRILDYSACHDSLTGLYNRSGVMSYAENLIRDRIKRTKFLAVMADLDHLKQINDTFGHNIGDEAIKKTAEILKKVLPGSAIIGRTGGDEFACLVPDAVPGMAELIQRLIKSECETYNDKEKRPYYLGISVGIYEFGREEDPGFMEVLKKADLLLYEAKKLRRSNVIRENI